MKVLFKKCCHTLVTLTLLMISSSAVPDIKSEKISFWDGEQQKGANIFNSEVTLEDISAAKRYGIRFIRLAPDKFKSAHRDFLIGNADDYQELVKEDLETLKKILDMCQAEKMPVVMTMLSLPGSRWSQNNQDQDDLRLWKEEKFRVQAALFWQDLAAELKNYPILVGYNILNEPHPERIFSPKSIHINTVRQNDVRIMINTLYSDIIKSIRSKDKETPIILDSSAYSDPKTIKILKPQEDNKILYSIHMYEPYEYTSHEINKGNFYYPGTINGKRWNKKTLLKYMSSVADFQKNHNIPNTRILVGEFGAYRMSPGIEKYFQDLISIFSQKGWHFAFYAFREDVWDGMDYELGPKKLPWSYWRAVERGQNPYLERKDTYPAFLMIKNALSK